MIESVIKTKISRTKNRLSLLKEFKKVLLNPQYNHFSIAYSGGKDSSLVLALFLDTLKILSPKEKEEIKKKNIFIVNSDTLIEIPFYQTIVKESLDNIQKALQEFPNIKIKKVIPELKNRYFSLLIGKGYTLPRKDYRWCTQRMKILPNDKLFKEIKNQINNETLVVFTGSRKEESADRKKRLESNQLEGYLKDAKNNKILFTPIENFTAQDVWTYLNFYEKKFPELNISKIRKLYDLGDKENEKYPQTRFGCMYCPLVAKDYTLESVSKKLYYLKPILYYRNWLVKFQNDWSVRDYYNHKTFKIIKYNLNNKRKNMVLPGGYSLNFRRKMFEKLLITERRVNKLKNYYDNRTIKGDRKIELVKDEEISYIQEKWTEEGELSLLALRIAKDFNRKIIPTERTLQIIKGAVKLYKEFYKKYGDNGNLEVDFYLPEVMRRYAVGYAEYLKTHDFEKMIKKMDEVDILEDYEIRIIKREWEKDKISYIRFLEMYENGEIDVNDYKNNESLFEDYGEFNEHVDFLKTLEHKNPLENEELMLEEKYQYLEGFRKKGRRLR